jgi:hypothetical protein
MNDSFEKKVRAAAVAGWWVFLIAYALLLVSWAVYLAIVSARPECYSSSPRPSRPLSGVGSKTSP